MSARVSKKAPKDANAPKKPLSSYFMFTRDRRAALKASQPELKTTELAKAMSVEWKALDGAAKDKYTAEAAQAKAEYATKFAEYKKTSEFGKFTLKLAEWKQANAERVGDVDMKSGKPGKPFKATKKPKDEKAPKRAQTAYFVFTASRRASLKAANPDAKVTQLAKLMGAEWKALSEDAKKPFTAEAAKAKETYTAAMATYKGSDDFAAHEEAIAAWKRNEKRSKAEADGTAPKVSLPRKPKDANKPKGAQTGYFLFTASRRAALTAENPSMKITQIAKLMGAEWKELSENDKAPFMAAAAKAKTASAAKMEAYRGSDHEKAFKAQLKEWEAECERRRAAALEKMEKKVAKMDLEVSKKNSKNKKGSSAKGNSKQTAKGKKAKGRGKKFEDSSSDDESGSESESESESGSESSSDEGSSSGADSSSEEESSSEE